jgi:hypothetical protein
VSSLDEICAPSEQPGSVVSSQVLSSTRLLHSFALELHMPGLGSVNIEPLATKAGGEEGQELF